MAERRDFTADIHGRTVTLRHAVRGEGDHAGLKGWLTNLYRKLTPWWPEGYVDADGTLLLPPVSVLATAARTTGENDSDIFSTIEAWCQCYPNTSDERVLEIAAKVRGENDEPYGMTDEDLHHLVRVFLEAHNAH